MPVDDPREEYDDLVVTTSRETLPPEEFDEAAGSEVATVGWLALALVFDGDGRILLINERGLPGWNVPGGALSPGETLRETARREIREETGIEATPVRPHLVDEFVLENAATGETDGWTAVFFEAPAETTDIADDPGLAGEAIDAVAWFETLPEELFNPEPMERVYRRCVS